MRWLNYHHLDHFRVVAQSGGLSAAAKRLRVASATLSEQMKELEAALGRPLFRRTGRGLALTDFGQWVLTYADRIFGLGEVLMRDAQIGPDSPMRVGVLTGLPEGMVRRALMPMLESGVRLVTEAGAAEALFNAQQASALDVLLLDAPLPAAQRVPGAQHVRLIDEPSMVWGAERWVAQAKEDWPTSLEQIPWILPVRGTAVRRQFDQWSYAQGWAIEPKVECETRAMAVSFACAGVGLCVAPLDGGAPGLQVITDLPAVRETIYALRLPQTQSQNLAALELLTGQ